MNDLDSRIVPDRELNDEDCATLWVQYLRQRIADATGRPVKGHDCVAPSHLEQQEARQWLLNPSMLLALACGATGLDMLALIGWARAREGSNWQIH